MRAWIISDLHSSRLDLLTPRPLVVPKADICICAGDITDGISRSIDYLKREIAPHMPVVATLGNHDYYGSSINGALEYARHATLGTNIRILENQIYKTKGLRVIGATLWTDFEIKNHSEGHLPVDARRRLAIRECSRRMMDFRQIIRSDRSADDEYDLIEPSEMLKRHTESRRFIETRLAEPFGGTTVVLTHHAPSAQSLDPQFEGHITNAAFTSDLDDVIRSGKPEFWIHGHIHRHSDYLEHKTRILCNPRGYHREAVTAGFRSGLVVDLSGMESGGLADD